MTPSKLFRKLHVERVASWFEDSKPMTRREFYLLFMLLFALITASLLGLKHLSDGRVKERERADFRGCVFTRDHIVIPDRQTVLVGPYKAIPTLRSLGFTPRKIDAYLREQYGGADPKLLEGAPPEGLGISPERAKALTSGAPDGVEAELERRPVPNCVDPDAPKPPGVEHLR